MTTPNYCHILLGLVIEPWLGSNRKGMKKDRHTDMYRTDTKEWQMQTHMYTEELELDRAGTTWNPSPCYIHIMRRRRVWRVSGLCRRQTGAINSREEEAAVASFCTHWSVVGTGWPLYQVCWVSSRALSCGSMHGMHSLQSFPIGDFLAGQLDWLLRELVDWWLVS